MAARLIRPWSGIQYGSHFGRTTSALSGIEPKEIEA